MVITALKRTVPFNIASVKTGQSWKALKVGRNTECVVSFGQRELLNHAVDVLELSEFDSLFRVESMSTRPGLYRKPVAKLLNCQPSFATNLDT